MLKKKGANLKKRCTIILQLIEKKQMWINPLYLHNKKAIKTKISLRKVKRTWKNSVLLHYSSSYSEKSRQPCSSTQIGF